MTPNDWGLVFAWMANEIYEHGEEDSLPISVAASWISLSLLPVLVLVLVYQGRSIPEVCRIPRRIPPYARRP